MIKKTLLGLGISLFSFIGFSNALDYTQNGYYYVGDVLVSYTSNVNNYSIDSLGNFSTNGHNLFYWVTDTYDNKTRSYSYSWLNGNLYFVGTNQNGENLTQYVVDKWCISPVSTRNYNNSVFHSDCNFNKTIEEVKSRVSSFSEYVVAIWGSSRPNWSFNNQLPLLLCLSDGDFDYCVACSIENCPSGSTGLDLNFSDGTLNTLSSYNWSYSFLGGGGYNINNYICPTVGQLLKTYSSEYNTGLCYSLGLVYSGDSVVSVPPQSIFNLFSNQSEFINYRQLYLDNCNLSVVDNVTCNNIFNGKNLQYSLISKIPENINSLNLYSYCNLALNQDSNTSTCVASGVYNTGVSRQDVINSITNGDYQVVVPSSGSITSEVIGSGSYFDGDIFSAIEGIYTKFTDFFTTQTGNIAGILPRYIISMLLVIILFRLFKK